jgi:hypothetical protein
VSNVSPSDGTTIALPRHSFKREVEDLDALIVEAGGTSGARDLQPREIPVGESAFESRRAA